MFNLKGLATQSVGAQDALESLNDVHFCTSLHNVENYENNENMEPWMHPLFRPIEMGTCSSLIVATKAGM